MLSFICPLRFILHLSHLTAPENWPALIELAGSLVFWLPIGFGQRGAPLKNVSKGKGIRLQFMCLWHFSSSSSRTGCFPVRGLSYLLSLLPKRDPQPHYCSPNYCNCNTLWFLYILQECFIILSANYSILFWYLFLGGYMW